MCYSAQVEQSLRTLERYFDAEIAWDTFEELFGQRLTDSSIKISKALELNFLAPRTDAEQRIKHLIDRYHAAKETEWQQEVFKQKKRLGDAERALKTKPTKKAVNDQRIATNKIETIVSRLADLKRTTLENRDSRIFPFTYAPIVIDEGHGKKIIAARYHCRQEGKPASIDKERDGLYNARRDNLERFWKRQFTKQHAVMLIRSFYENIALNDFEQRELRAEEKPQNVVLHFNPKPIQEMVVACLWSRWSDPTAPTLLSFAAITDEPPPEIAAAGHDRVVITLKPENVDAWLRSSASAEQYSRLLDDRQRPYFEHRRAA